MNPLLFSIIFVMTHTRKIMNTAPLNRQGNKHSSNSPSILCFIKATFPEKLLSKSYCPLCIFCEHSSVHHKTKRKPQHLENIGISIVTQYSVFTCRKKLKYKKISKIKGCYLYVGQWQCRMYWKKVNIHVPWKILFLKSTKIPNFKPNKQKKNLRIPF